MFKYLISASFALFLSLYNAYAESDLGLSESNVQALRVLAGRKGLLRLDFNEQTRKWSYFDSSYVTYFKRFVTSKNRHDIIVPLENLVKDVEDTHWASVSKNPEIFHLIRRSYSSLSSLYSFYKINPDSNAERQVQFITRFGEVLRRFKSVLESIEGRLKTKDLYKPMPWFGEQGHDVKDNDKNLGLNYLDMGPKALSELNSQLLKIGNDDTKVVRAMEFYPSREKTTVFKSSLNESITKKPVIFVVHGTFAAGSPEYHSDMDLLFQQTKYMAQSLANDQNMPVEVYSFGWNGRNDNVARIDAGMELANLVNTYFPKEEYNDIYIGHSHGGNVVYHFAKTVRCDRTPEMIITLATPVRKDFITDNVNYLFQFYTDSDLIQYLGSYEMTSRAKEARGEHEQSFRMVRREDIEKLGYFANNNRYDSVKIYATKVLHNFQNLKGPIQSHSDLKHMIAVLPRVLDTLLQYKPNNQFLMNVDLDEKLGLAVSEMDRLKFQIIPTAVAK